MSRRPTISTIFIVPTLNIDKNKLRNCGFLNAFETDTNKEEHYGDCVYLLFKPSNLDVFKEFLDEEYEETRKSGLVDDYDYEEGYVVLVYKLPKKWTRDFNLIKLGKYSQTSDEFKSIFPEKVEVILNGHKQIQDSLQHRIFNKDEDLKKHWEEKLDVRFKEDFEVWQIYIPEKETLDINKIKELV